MAAGLDQDLKPEGHDESVKFSISDDENVSPSTSFEDKGRTGPKLSPTRPRLSPTGPRLSPNKSDGAGPMSPIQEVSYTSTEEGARDVDVAVKVNDKPVEIVQTRKFEVRAVALDKPKLDDKLGSGAVDKEETKITTGGGSDKDLKLSDGASSSRDANSINDTKTAETVSLDKAKNVFESGSENQAQSANVSKPQDSQERTTDAEVISSAKTTNDVVGSGKKDLESSTHDDVIFEHLYEDNLSVNEATEDGKAKQVICFDICIYF